jgi:hypothetical protein
MAWRMSKIFSRVMVATSCWPTTGRSRRRSSRGTC